MVRILSLAALLVSLALAPARAEEDAARLDALFAALQDAGARDWERVEEQIWAEWSRSGSAIMDFLLARGREALAEGDTGAALEHLTALVENAPEFAEGWNSRATAFYEAEMFGPAIADIARVLVLEPRHFGALTGLGLIFEAMGQPQKALAAFEAALAIHPHRPDLREAVTRLEAELQGKRI